MLMLYNSLTRQKEQFKSIVEGHIGLYVCGITVYDHCHLGHARSMVSFDVIVRFLRASGYNVKFVRNITDIDDKIINRAIERAVSIDALTAEFIASMHADTSALNCLEPDAEPRATAYIDKIIDLISSLLEKNKAYVSDDGDVCYDVSSFPAYGALSQQDLNALMSGARIEVVESKRSPMDFVLWKKVKPGEPSWSSPWGEGRPGWHIECSAMAMGELGAQFDLHGGGLDLQFPHHENEIAQSEGSTGHPFANYWLHVGMLQVNHEKMSKSLGNFFTISDVLKKHHPEVVRYFLLSSHYRSPLNYSDDTILLAGKALMRLYQSMRGRTQSTELSQPWIKRFDDAMNDDFNTPVALSVLFELSHDINKTNDAVLVSTLIHLGKILGILQAAPELFLKSGVSAEAVTRIENLINERLRARQIRDFNRADEIRSLLLSEGVEIEDAKDGTTWRMTV